MDALTITYQIAGIVSSASVVITVPIAIVTLRRVVVQRRSESLERVVIELRDPEFRELAATVYKNLSIVAARQTDRRVKEFIVSMKSKGDEVRQRDIVRDAVELVNRLNNIAAMIEQGAVREKDLHGQTHPRIIELAARLEPFILARSAALGYRWGMRVRRLSAGAKSYYRTSSLHRRKPLAREGIVLVPAVHGWRWRLSRESFRAMTGRYMPAARATRKQDERDIAAAKTVLLEFGAGALTFLDP